VAKFKVIRLQDINQIESTLNEFDLGEIVDFSIAVPDYRIIVLVVRYDEPENKKDDKATK
jgi:hypothetical protein